jgi:hypothetical protein
MKCPCRKNASFGLSTENKRKWCSKCKDTGAILINKFKCKCGKYPSFGRKGERIKLWCAGCRPPKSILLNKQKKCKCDKQPSFGYEHDRKIKWCSTCRPKGTINLKNPNVRRRLLRPVTETAEHSNICTRSKTKKQLISDLDSLIGINDQDFEFLLPVDQRSEDLMSTNYDLQSTDSLNKWSESLVLRL